jgi:hypothetical protein
VPPSSATRLRQAGRLQGGDPGGLANDGWKGRHKESSVIPVALKLRSVSARGGRAKAGRGTSGSSIDSHPLVWYLRLPVATGVNPQVEIKWPAANRRMALPQVEAPRDQRACFPIGIVADALGVTEPTLRLYGSHELGKPSRRNRERHSCAVPASSNGWNVRAISSLRRRGASNGSAIAPIRPVLRDCWFPQGSVLPPTVRCSADGPAGRR